MVCSYSFELAFQAQSSHTFEKDPVQKVTMPNLRKRVGKAGQRFQHYEEGLSGASSYGHVGTVGIALACPLQGFLFVVREKCNQLLDRFRMIFKCTWKVSSPLTFLSSRTDTFAYWAILLCRGISPYADANIFTALLPVSHTKTVFQWMYKAVGLFHRL